MVVLWSRFLAGTSWRNARYNVHPCRSQLLTSVIWNSRYGKQNCENVMVAEPQPRTCKNDLQICSYDKDGPSSHCNASQWMCARRFAGDRLKGQPWGVELCMRHIWCADVFSRKDQRFKPCCTCLRLAEIVICADESKTIPNIWSRLCYPCSGGLLANAHWILQVITICRPIWVFKNVGSRER